MQTDVNLHTDLSYISWVSYLICVTE